MIVRWDVIIKKHNNGFQSRTSSTGPPTVPRTIPESSLSGPRETENFNNSDSSFSDPDRRPVLSYTSENEGSNNEGSDSDKSDKDSSGEIQ